LIPKAKFAWCGTTCRKSRTAGPEAAAGVREKAVPAAADRSADGAK
jgi:hypothetical protein